MAKLPKQVPIRYVGPKQVEEDTVSGAKSPDGSALFWTSRQVQFVTREQAGKLLHYPSMWEDARTEDDKAKHGPLAIIKPHDPRYDDLTDQEAAEGMDVMPLVNVNLLDKRGLVHFAGTYLGKRLDVDDSLASLRDQVNRAVEGKRYEWA